MTARNRFSTFISAAIGLFRPQQQEETGEHVSINRTNEWYTAQLLGGYHNQRPLYYTPVRDAPRARQIVNLCQVPEVASIISTIADDVLSSEDGDDIGFSIAETLEDGTAIDPKLRDIGNQLIKRILTTDVVKPIITEFLGEGGGDCFRSLLVDQSFTGIIGLKELPTWEMFRIEDNDGQVERFEQRRYIGEAEGALEIHPALLVHWRFRRRRMYGRSLFEEAIGDVSALDRGYSSLDKAIVSVGVNPNHHEMPEGYTPDMKKAYIRAHESKLKQGRVITDYYSDNGGKVGKVADNWPDFSALSDNIDKFRVRLAMQGRVPLWMVGIVLPGARDIQGGPALAYARTIGSVRQTLAYGLKQIIDFQLILNGYLQPEAREYRLIFPKFYTSPVAQSKTEEGEEDQLEAGENGEADEDGGANSSGIEDLDSMRLLRMNGNGRH